MLGPKLGRELGAVREALRAGAFEELDGGRFRAAGHELEPDEVLVERAGKEGWAVAAEDGVTVALDTHVDEELERERRVYELIRQVNALRKESGLELSDRIALTIPERDADLLERTRTGSAPRRSPLARGRRRRRADDREGLSERYSGRAAASSSSRRSSTGSRNVTSSSTIRKGWTSSTPRARNQSQTRVTRCSGADAPDVMPTVSRPSSQRLVDLALVVDQVRGHAGGACDVDQAVRVRRVPRADHEQDVDVREEVLHRPLAVGGRVADVLFLRPDDLPGSACAASR